PRSGNGSRGGLAYRTTLDPRIERPGTVRPYGDSGVAARRARNRNRPSVRVRRVHRWHPGRDQGHARRRVETLGNRGCDRTRSRPPRRALWRYRTDGHDAVVALRPFAAFADRRWL